MSEDSTPKQVPWRGVPNVEVIPTDYDVFTPLGFFNLRGPLDRASRHRVGARFGHG